MKSSQLTIPKPHQRPIAPPSLTKTPRMRRHFMASNELQHAEAILADTRYSALTPQLRILIDFCTERYSPFRTTETKQLWEPILDAYWQRKEIPLIHKAAALTVLIMLEINPEKHMDRIDYWLQALSLLQLTKDASFAYCFREVIMHYHNRHFKQMIFSNNPTYATTFTLFGERRPFYAELCLLAARVDNRFHGDGLPVQHFTHYFQPRCRANYPSQIQHEIFEALLVEGNLHPYTMNKTLEVMHRHFNSNTDTEENLTSLGRIAAAAIHGCSSRQQQYWIKEVIRNCSSHSPNAKRFSLEIIAGFGKHQIFRNNNRILDLIGQLLSSTDAIAIRGGLGFIANAALHLPTGQLLNYHKHILRLYKNDPVASYNQALYAATLSLAPNLGEQAQYTLIAKLLSQLSDYRHTTSKSYEDFTRVCHRYPALYNPKQLDQLLSRMTDLKTLPPLSHRTAVNNLDLVKSILYLCKQYQQHPEKLNHALSQQITLFCVVLYTFCTDIHIKGYLQEILMLFLDGSVPASQFATSLGNICLESMTNEKKLTDSEAFIQTLRVAAINALAQVINNVSLVKRTAPNTNLIDTSLTLLLPLFQRYNPDAILAVQSAGRTASEQDKKEGLEVHYGYALLTNIISDLTQIAGPFLSPKGRSAIYEAVGKFHPICPYFLQYCGVPRDSAIPMLNFYGEAKNKAMEQTCNLLMQSDKYNFGTGLCHQARMANLVFELWCEVDRYQLNDSITATAWIPEGRSRRIIAFYNTNYNAPRCYTRQSEADAMRHALEIIEYYGVRTYTSKSKPTPRIHLGGAYNGLIFVTYAIQSVEPLSQFAHSLCARMNKLTTINPGNKLGKFFGSHSWIDDEGKEVKCSGDWVTFMRNLQEHIIMVIKLQKHKVERGSWLDQFIHFGRPEQDSLLAKASELPEFSPWTNPNMIRGLNEL